MAAGIDDLVLKDLVLRVMEAYGDDWWLLPWVKEAYEDGYRMAWHESRIPGMHLDENAAFNDWASRLGDKF